MTDTEKLGDKFYQIIKEHGKDGKAYQVDLLLQACKQSGLKFVPEEWDIPNAYFFGKLGAQRINKGIVLKAINSQIKEIE